MGFLCPVESPDGKNAGIHKELSIGCDVTMSLEHLIRPFTELLLKNADKLALKKFDSFINTD